MSSPNTVAVPGTPTNGAQSPTPTPSNTSLTDAFFTQFNISDEHLLPCDIDTLPASPADQELLFRDLHDDHNVATNSDLLFEVLLQAHTHVPEWSKIPFEIFITLINLQPITGGLTNLLLALELTKAMVDREELKATRPPTLQAMINQVTQEFTDLLTTFDYSSIELPTTTKVAVRVYGTNEFNNRTAELALAKLAAQQGISELVFCSWRHGRITSFINGRALMDFNDLGYWLNPIFAQSSAYLQGKLHAAPFPAILKEPADDISTTSPLLPGTAPAMIPILKQWCKKSYATGMAKKLFGTTANKPSSRAQEGATATTTPQVSSVFDMFTAEDTQLYTIKKPSNASRNNEYHRLDSVVLPLPTKLAHIIVPLLNAPQVVAENNDKANRMPRDEELVVNKYNLLNDEAKKLLINEDICPENRVLTPEENLLVLEYLDLKRLRDEIDWLEQVSASFPCVTSHSDFHSGNVLLLNSLTKMTKTAIDMCLEQQQQRPTTNENTTNVTSDAAAAENEVAAVETYVAEDLPLNLPNQFLDWLKIIDFEYGGYSFRGYDVANSLTEGYISYEGDYPGFTLNAPGTISTHLLAAQCIQPTLAQQLNPALPYENTHFDHPMKPYLLENATKDKMAKILTTQSQPEEEEIGAQIQALILGEKFCTKEAQDKYITPLDKTNDLVNTIPQPQFRPREYYWAKNNLIGFYHALRQSNPNPDVPIYPFKNQPDYVLPNDIEQWLADQIPNLLYESMILSYAPNLVWTFWGIILTETAQIGGFGYIEHALARMVCYVAKKNVMLKMGLVRENTSNSNKK